MVFGYSWLCAKAQRCKWSAEILGLDMSRAFDTIRRDRLMEVLQMFLDESELRIIQLLSAETSLEPRLQKGTCEPFDSTIGTPHCLTVFVFASTTRSCSPLLLYNMGTWGLSQKQNDQLDSFHRSQLRQIIGMWWPHRISNKALYCRCKCGPLIIRTLEARWRLFGHVLRLPRDVPVQKFIDEYFGT